MPTMVRRSARHRCLLLCWLAAGMPAQDPAPALSAPLAKVGSAYAAKVTASALFVSGRTQQQVLAEEFAPDAGIAALFRALLKLEVDRDAGTVTATLLGHRSTAVHVPGQGCVLLGDGDVATLRAARPKAPPPLPADDWPKRGAATERLAAAVELAFTGTGRGEPQTRAVVVLHDGALLAERYADGITADTALPGWSMTKSLVDALLGAAVHRGRFDLAAPLDVPEWRTAGDARAAITADDLLRMRGGLAWQEDYSKSDSDALRMLFASADHGAAYAQRPAAAPPGTGFLYSSGSTNLLCRVLRARCADDAAYWRLPRELLFAPLGTRTFVLEPDRSGTFVGSSYGFASARDWARIAQFYLQDGVWNGVRLLPEGWVAASTAPHRDGPGHYGRHWWLNRSHAGARAFAGLPEDLFYMSGFEGQYAAVVPSRKLVAVRLGCSHGGSFAFGEWLAAVLAAVPVSGSSR